FAATYRRGCLKYLAVPTTLLAAVDVALTPRNAINIGEKSHLGTYYPPASVLIDPSFLQTTNSSSLSDGVAEIMRTALVADAGLFDLLEREGSRLIANKFQNELGSNVIWQAVKL